MNIKRIIIVIVSIVAIHLHGDQSTSLQESAIKAYVYAYPLVIMHITQQVSTNVAQPTVDASKVMAPLNQFAHVPTFPTHQYNDIVRPNVDTLYSMAWLDLTKEPIILCLPDTHDRYYLMPLLDAWTNVFASLGKRTTGTKAQNFAIVGPNWHGKLPRGIKRVAAPTNTVWIIGRTQTNGIDDYAYVHAIQQGYKLIPLSSWGSDYQPTSDAPINPAIDNTVAPMDQVARMDAQEFFTTFATLLKNNPPPKQDKKIMQELKKVGIEVGTDFDFAALNPEVQESLIKAIPLAQKKMAQEIRNFPEQKNGWGIMRTHIGTYGTNYLTRAAIAMFGIGANLPQDAIYPVSFVDESGKPLAGNNQYRMHFNKDEIPPVHAFWSITLYNAKGFLVPNSIDRYALGDRDELTFNEDGSVDIYIQHEAPKEFYKSNWLPTPADGFNLTMRLYWPKKIVLDGSWAPALIVKRNNKV